MKPDEAIAYAKGCKNERERIGKAVKGLLYEAETKHINLAYAIEDKRSRGDFDAVLKYLTLAFKATIKMELYREVLDLLDGDSNG